AELRALGEELAAAVVLIADHHLTTPAARALQEADRDLFLVDLRGAQLQRPWGAVRGDQGMEPESPEVFGMRRAPAVISSVRERVVEAGGAGAFDRLARPRARHRGRVDQQQIVIE